VKRSRRFGTLAASLAAAVLWPVLAASAQGLPQRGMLQAGTGASFETYEFLDPDVVGLSRLSLFTVPFAVRGLPLERLQLQASGAYAQGVLKRTDGSEATLSGPTDTELRASYVLGRDLVVISAAYLVPTGSRAYTLDEAEVAGTIAADLLPFRITQWGSGGGLGVSTAVAVPVGEFGIGFSLGYTVAQEYDALQLPDEGAWRYHPGNELRLRLGVDRTFGDAGKASLLLNLQRYDEDRLQGQSLLQPGNRYDLTGFYSFATGRGANGVTYLGVAHRDAATFTEREAQDLFFAGMEIPAQDLIFAGAGFRVPLGARVFVPSVEGRLIRRSDGLNQGHMVGVGASMEWRAGSVLLVPALRSRFGKVLLWDGEEASFRGGELGLSIRMGGRR
jgi:hypothetical protein